MNVYGNFVDLFQVDLHIKMKHSSLPITITGALEKEWCISFIIVCLCVVLADCVVL